MSNSRRSREVKAFTHTYQTPFPPMHFACTSSCISPPQPPNRWHEWPCWHCLCCMCVYMRAQRRKHILFGAHKWWEGRAGRATACVFACCIPSARFISPESPLLHTLPCFAFCRKPNEQWVSRTRGFGYTLVMGALNRAYPFQIPCSESIPKPTVELNPESEWTWESQFAPESESELTPELELAPEWESALK